jgi:hypothetical protein
LKKKTPEQHPDFDILIKAIDKVQMIANQNEAMQREVENLQTIVAIQQRLQHVRSLTHSLKFTLRMHIIHSSLNQTLKKNEICFCDKFSADFVGCWISSFHQRR